MSFATSIRRTRSLATSQLFENPNYQLPNQERVVQSFKRAKSVALAYGLTRDDIKNLSPRYWEMHVDPILVADGAATTLLTIQLNLCAGTIAAYADDRPELSSILDDLLNFNIGGQFCMTELDHGLDAINMETTATMLPNNEGFVLHTPHMGAAKFMPPTVPNGTPCIAVVYARLIVDGESRGVVPFVVPLHDGQTMSPGVKARLLPARSGPHPVNHSITSFDRVYLPSSALLATDTEDASPDALRIKFLLSIWRVAVGSISLAAIAVPALATSAYICARYSQRRTVASSPTSTGRTSLIRFKTTYTPILTALARSFVLKELYSIVQRIFVDEDVDFRVRHGVAAAMKVVAIQHTQEANIELSERCGAQGLFEHNQICAMHAEMRGIAIAEGDLLGISIRLLSEIILGRYSLPPSTHPTSPLALHEEALISECRAALTVDQHHRSDNFNRYILPRCQPAVEAMGLRMAYDAALDAGMDDTITELYLCAAIKRDSIWYSENLGRDFSRTAMYDREEKALNKALPKLEEWLDAAGVREYVKAPIVSQEKWNKFVDRLKTFSFYSEDTRDIVFEPIQARL